MVASYEIRFKWVAHLRDWKLDWSYFDRWGGVVFWLVLGQASSFSTSGSCSLVTRPYVTALGRAVSQVAVTAHAI